MIGKYERNDNPWFSIDTKSKEHRGRLYRKGRLRGSLSFEAFDHDLTTWADGVLWHATAGMSIWGFPMTPAGSLATRWLMLFDCLNTVVDLMRGAKSRAGLRTTANVIRKAYEVGRNATDQMKADLRVIHADLLPKWNYVAKP